MSPDESPKTLSYVGADTQIANFLAVCCAVDGFAFDDCRAENFSLPTLSPSWHCRRVIVLDEFERIPSRRLLESLFQQDAGIPVIVLLDGNHPECVTFAGLARVCGAHRLLLKPLTEREPLQRAVASAFQRLDHWATHFSRRCPGDGGEIPPGLFERGWDRVAVAAPSHLGAAPTAAAMAAI
jgi:hypothetical protein